METKELIPVSEVQKLAQSVAKGGLFAAFKNPDHALTLMMLCQSDGLHPIQALRRFDVIQGRPAMKSDAMLADFQTRGGRVAWDVLTDKEVTATFEAPGLSKPVTVTWTIDMAKGAGLAGKDNWRNYPRAMLRARVVSEGIRIAMPAIVAGVYTPEEVQDFGPIPAPSVQSAAVDVEVVETLEPAPAKPAQSPERAKKIRDLAIAIKRAGVTEENRKAWMAEKVGHPVESSKDLTDEEIAKLFKATEAANG